MLIRVANINDIPQLRFLYEELERDGVKYQPEHFIRTQVYSQNINGMRFYERIGFCKMMKTIECQFKNKGDIE